MNIKDTGLAAIAFAVIVSAGAAAAQNAAPNASGSGPARTDKSIEYHNGPVMHGSSNVYFIWYGCWGTTGCNYGGTNDATTMTLLPEFLINLGSSPYFQINAGYPDANGAAPSGDLVLGGQVVDRYSRGNPLSEADLGAVVANQMATFGLPVDLSAIYVILTSADVSVEDTNTHFCITCCQRHGHFTYSGGEFKYVFVGNPARCPGSCASGAPTPNGNLQSDWMALWLAHALSGTVTNPLGTGWYDHFALENADKCEDTYGATYSVTNPNGQTAQANVRLGSRDYFIEQNWVNGKKGHCAMSSAQ